MANSDTPGDTGDSGDTGAAIATAAAGQTTSGSAPQRQVGDPAKFGKPGAYLAALAALWLALHEISVLSAGFLAPGGQYASFNTLSGMNALGERSSWNDMLTTEQLGNWFQMLVWYESLDAAFIIVYTIALRALVIQVARVSALTWVGRLRWVVYALAVVDALELVGQLGLGLARDPVEDSVPGWAVIAVAIVTSLKWLLIAALVVSFVCILIQSCGPDLRRRVRGLWLAVKIQRFSLLAFLPIAVLAVVPLDELNNLFGQLPDVQRAWLDGWSGAWYAFAAAFVFGVCVLPPVFYLGRLRADWAARREAGDNWWPFYDSPDGPERRQHKGLWMTGPAVIAIAAALALLQGGSVVWTRLAVFCAVPLLVIGLSAVIRRFGWNKLAKLPPRAGSNLTRDVMAVGDIFTFAALSLAGLGMIRAFMGVWVLDATGTRPFEYAVGLPWLPLILGVVIAIGSWLAAESVLTGLAHWGRDSAGAGAARGAGGQVRGSRRWRDSRDDLGKRIAYVVTPGLDTSSRRDIEDPRVTVRVGLLAVSVAIFMTMALSPRGYATVFGSLGVAVLGMGTLMLMLGVTVAYAQDRQPPELFANRWLRLKATPIISILLFAAIVAGWVGKPTDVHPVTAPGTIPDRPTLETAFGDWLAADSCLQPRVEDTNFNLRPLLMYGAEGGGIRASYWTASALQRISDAGDGCGQRAGLFSTGASGGALGLTVARFDVDPLAVVDAMSGPDALSQASASLVTGDLLRAAAGLRFEADTPYRDPERQGLDRAGLMETAWEGDSALAELQIQDFLPDPGDPDDKEVNPYADDGKVTGHLVLTSSAARDGCRTLLSRNRPERWRSRWRGKR